MSLDYSGLSIYHKSIGGSTFLLMCKSFRWGVPASPAGICLRVQQGLKAWSPRRGGSPSGACMGGGGAHTYLGKRRGGSPDSSCAQSRRGPRFCAAPSLRWLERHPRPEPRGRSAARSGPPRAQRRGRRGRAWLGAEAPPGQPRSARGRSASATGGPLGPGAGPTPSRDGGRPEASPPTPCPRLLRREAPRGAGGGAEPLRRVSLGPPWSRLCGARAGGEGRPRSRRSARPKMAAARLAQTPAASSFSPSRPRAPPRPPWRARPCARRVTGRRSSPWPRRARSASAAQTDRQARSLSALGRRRSCPGRFGRCAAGLVSARGRGLLAHAHSLPPQAHAHPQSSGRRRGTGSVVLPAAAARGRLRAQAAPAALAMPPAVTAPAGTCCPRQSLPPPRPVRSAAGRPAPAQGQVGASQGAGRGRGRGRGNERASPSRS